MKYFNFGDKIPVPSMFFLSDSAMPIFEEYKVSSKSVWEDKISN